MEELRDPQEVTANGSAKAMLVQIDTLLSISLVQEGANRESHSTTHNPAPFLFSTTPTEYKRDKNKQRNPLKLKCTFQN